jgi:predicted O-methyltransferase YrrM
MSLFTTGLNFFRHRFFARSWDRFHSPYLYTLFSYCCDDIKHFDYFDRIEKDRLDFMHSREKIKRTDPGAGSHYAFTPAENISRIARTSLSQPYECRFLYRLMKKINPEVVIELGTSLGISTSYLATGAPQSQVITVEGDPALALWAHQLFTRHNISNIRLCNSTFDNFIARDLPEIKKVDFVFLDGNHKASALLSYYESLRPYFNTHTILMVDDIYWSEDMH